MFLILLSNWLLSWHSAVCGMLYLNISCVREYYRKRSYPSLLIGGHLLFEGCTRSNEQHLFYQHNKTRDYTADGSICMLQSAHVHQYLSMIHCKKMAAPENAVLFHQCAMIQFLIQVGSSAANNFDQLRHVCGDSCMSASSVKCCVKHCKDGNSDIADTFTLHI
jgi:hypothetical protein